MRKAPLGEQAALGVGLGQELQRSTQQRRRVGESASALVRSRQRELLLLIASVC